MAQLALLFETSNDLGMNKPVSTFAFALILIAAAALPARADNISGTLDLDDYYGYSDGGPFTALFLTGTPQGAVDANYSPLALTDDGGATATGFETFCVETGVNFTPGNWGGPVYDFTTGIQIQQNDSYGFLTEGAAWLYQQYATGMLSTIDPNFSYTNSISSGSLQFAIWDLVGESGTPDSFGDPGIGQELVNLATNKFGANAISEVTSTTDFGVQVLELTTVDGNDAQDQLIYAPVPDGGTTLVYLTIVLVGIAALARRDQPQARRI